MTWFRDHTQRLSARDVLHHPYFAPIRECALKIPDPSWDLKDQGDPELVLPEVYILIIGDNLTQSLTF